MVWCPCCMKAPLLAALALVLLLASVTPVRSDESLEALVAQAYGPRRHSDQLHQIAHQRAVQIVTDWSHDQRVSWTWEVLAYNSSSPERAIVQWQGSPTHHSILSDPSLTQIGCAQYDADGFHWYVCVLDDEPEPAPTPAPAPAPVPSAPPKVEQQEPPAPQGAAPGVLLPDTALAR